jgi:hypothetical protein
MGCDAVTSKYQVALKRWYLSANYTASCPRRPKFKFVLFSLQFQSYLYFISLCLRSKWWQCVLVELCRYTVGQYSIVMTTLVSKQTIKQEPVYSTLYRGYGKIPWIACLYIAGNRYNSPSSEFPYLLVPSSNHPVHRNVARANHGQRCGIFRTHQRVLDGNVTADWEGNVSRARMRIIHGTSFRGCCIAGLSGF